jgi:outer membrane protein OmpA-like peptidoglycan-associated protein
MKPSVSFRRPLLLALLVVIGAIALTPATALATSPFPVDESFQNSTVGSAWYTGGNALLTAPSLDANGSGWLRLTSATGNQFGYIINDTAFPSNNGIDVSFDYASYGGTGADGLTFFLYDGSTPESSFATGQAGGSLGYAGCPASNLPGLTNAYVGVGFDEWGNFANTGFCGITTGYASGLQPNRVTIRGAAGADPRAATAYPYLTSVPTTQSLKGTSRASARHVTVSVTPDMKVAVYITYPDGSVQTVTSGYQLPTAPATLKFGWVASTGGSTDVHEIRNTTVAEPADLKTTLVSGPTSSDRSGTLTYTFNVTNVGQNPTTGSTITATTPGGVLQNVSWTCTSTTATCGAASGTGLPSTTADLPVGASATYTITGQPTSTTSYGSMTLEADPTGATTQSVPNDNVASATTDITPAESTAPSMTLSNTNGYTGQATGTQGTYIGRSVTITDHWQHCASDGSSCTDIPGATSLTYTTGSVDRGYTLRLHEHASNSGGSIDEYTSTYNPLPHTSATTTMPSVTNQTGAAFTLSSGTSGVAYECKLDSGAWSSCSSTPSYSNLADGTHTFTARAVYAGLSDPTGASHTWTVDTVAPGVQLTGPTSGPTNTTKPTVNYTGEPGDQFTVTVDGQPVATGVIPNGGTGSLTLPTALSDGPHMITISVADGAGNQNSRSIVVTIDTVTPATVQIDSAPAQFTQNTDGTFTFSDAQSGVTYQCSLDGASWTACSSPVSFPGLANGPHTALVRAIDPAGNVSPSTQYAWTVMTTPPPPPTILGGPNAFTLPSPAQFQISVAPGTTLECSLDGQAYEPCSDVVDLFSLPLGSHSLAVRQVDEAGNASAPSIYSWNVLASTGAHGLPRHAKLLIAEQSTASSGRNLNVGCNLDAGSVQSCDVKAYYNGRLIGTGTARERRPGHTHMIVAVRLNSTGRRLLAGAVDGLPVRFRGSARPFQFGRLSARARTVVYEPQRYVITDVLFDFNSAKLTHAAKSILREIASELRGARSVVCEGNTDSYGSAAYNYRLGLRRAATVCTALRRLAVHARMSTVSYGAHRPVATNRTASGRHLNRRVLVRVSYYDLPRR